MSLRTGYASGAHVSASFGDFGTFRESSGAFQIGVGIPPTPRLRLWAGAAGELTPVYGYEVGLEVLAWRSVVVGARAGVSLRDTTNYRFLGVGISCSDTIRGTMPFLTPAIEAPQRDW